MQVGSVAIFAYIASLDESIVSSVYTGVAYSPATNITNVCYLVVSLCLLLSLSFIQIFFLCSLFVFILCKIGSGVCRTAAHLFQRNLLLDSCILELNHLYFYVYFCKDFFE